MEIETMDVCPGCGRRTFGCVCPKVSESPETPGYVNMPARLTAENGAKAALMGEFAVPFPIICPRCQDDDGEYCEECANSGEVKLNVNVPWTVIKQIYAKAVDLLGP